MDLLPGLAAVVAPFLGAALTLRLSKRKRALRWVTLTPISMMDIADEVGEKLKVVLDEKRISNLTKFAFVIHNCGREPIDANAIYKPVKWKAPGRIIDARVTGSKPVVDLKLQKSGRELPHFHSEVQHLPGRRISPELEGRIASSGVWAASFGGRA